MFNYTIFSKEYNSIQFICNICQYKTGVKKIPMLRFFFKIVVVKSLNQAIVIIDNNNPIVTDEELKTSYKYCTDTCITIQ